jgi:hypothetical protein
MVVVAFLAASAEGGPPAARIVATRMPTSSARQAIVSAIRPTIFDGDVLDKAGIGQAPTKCGDICLGFTGRPAAPESDRR